MKKDKVKKKKDEDKKNIEFYENNDLKDDASYKERVKFYNGMWGGLL